MAIFVMNRELHLLQGFTSNRELLNAALNHKGSMVLSSLLDNPVSGGLDGDSTLSGAFADAVGNNPSFGQTISSLQQLEAEQEAFLLTLRAQYTLDSMNQLARFLAGLPGRKNLIWFSGSFPLDLMPDGTLPDPFAAMGDSEDEFRETVTLMDQSHVAVYPVDVRGLMVNPIMNAEGSGHKYSADPTGVQRDTGKFFAQTASEQSTMSLMAEKTGGKAYYNTNGLKQAVDDIIQSGSNFYSLSYTPSRKKSNGWDGNYHSISIQLTDPALAHAKVKLSYRVGYYADDPNLRAPRKAKLPPLLAFSSPQPEPVAVHPTAAQAAMMFSAPEPTQIVMKVLVRPKGDKPEDSLADGNATAPKIHGPYRRYTLDYAVDARHVAFVAGADGTFKAVVEFTILVYDDQGEAVNTLNRSAEANVDAAHRAAMIRSGIHFHEEISVPAKGRYWLRIGVHDKTSDGLGAVEVDLERVRNIAGIAAEHSPPAAAK
jgi:VWFA-related protein